MVTPVYFLRNAVVEEAKGNVSRRLQSRTSQIVLSLAREKKYCALSENLVNICVLTLTLTRSLHLRTNGLSILASNAPRDIRSCINNFNYPCSIQYVPLSPMQPRLLSKSSIRTEYQIFNRTSQDILRVPGSTNWRTHNMSSSYSPKPSLNLVLTSPADVLLPFINT